MKKKGNINVQTENIFPIIKQFLYSDHEIFLRELVSNAVDATQKLKTLKTIGELNTDIKKLRVEVILDRDAKTITIRDNGIGMTDKELDKYINQIAFSGAEEFVNKYKDADTKNSIIGHFGLGFYSAFMVAKEVEIVTKSQLPNSKPVKWTCDGSPNFTMEETKKKTKGTDIILHIADDSTEFLEESRLSTILNKYCKFLPVEIKFGTKTEKIDDPKGKKDDKGDVIKIDKISDNIINNTSPAWTKKPSNLKEEHYKSFYRELYPMEFSDPLFHIHLNVDFPFNLTGILYFPKLKNNLEVQKNKINLYSNQVFITDNVENIVPEFLTLLHGVIDSPDIPLNVSRSYLQADGNVKKIASHITKKVADKLARMFKKDRKDFEQKWDDVKVFIEYGMLTEQKFFDKAKEFAIYKNTESKYYTFNEFVEKVKESQKNKDGKTIILYTNDAKEQHSFVQTATAKGYEVLELGGPLISHLISRLESDNSDVQFARVDADVIDKLIEKEESTISKLSEKEQEKLKKVIEDTVDKEKFTVQIQNMSSSDAPIVITQSEFMRRMKEQQQLSGGGGMQMFGSMPEAYNLAINSNHALISKILEEKTKKKRTNLINQLLDLALLSQGMLKGEDLTKFISRSVSLIK
ncbi:MAG: molecular chaperone HtpG [Flavobacteriales bacterium]|nr:molecular chaperone HtpG [Flavobacteriales bacterium]|tara:strand:- start:16304 stop:18208 length:1905 start_codon:yes stop_codon:yes gene_type:complete